jgi:hypothetical protein
VATVVELKMAPPKAESRTKVVQDDERQQRWFKMKRDIGEKR